jgi:hypothetical protein
VGDLRHMINFQIESLSTFVPAVEGELKRLFVNTLIFSLI